MLSVDIPIGPPIVEVTLKILPKILSHVKVILRTLTRNKANAILTIRTRIFADVVSDVYFF